MPSIRELNLMAAKRSLLSANNDLTSVCTATSPLAPRETSARELLRSVASLHDEIGQRIALIQRNLMADEQKEDGGPHGKKEND